MNRLSLPLMAILAGATLVTTAEAQDATPGPRTHTRHHRVAVASAGAPVAYRGLTINRPPEALPPVDDDRDIDRDGPVRYNDVRDFSPSPYTTSGVQYPFGLDGVGGYGSDLGFGAGDDAALYDRGANNRP